MSEETVTVVVERIDGEPLVAIVTAIGGLNAQVHLPAWPLPGTFELLEGWVEPKVEYREPVQQTWRTTAGVRSRRCFPSGWVATDYEPEFECIGINSGRCVIMSCSSGNVTLKGYKTRTGFHARFPLERRENLSFPYTIAYPTSWLPEDRSSYAVSPDGWRWAAKIRHFDAEGNSQTYNLNHGAPASGDLAGSVDGNALVLTLKPRSEDGQD